MVLALTVSCKTKQSSLEGVDENAKAMSIIRAARAKDADFDTMRARLGLTYTDASRSQTVTVDLRIKKGEVIWMSATVLGFTGAKVMITPDSVKFYERLDSRAFEGDFRIIEKYLGEELTYKQMEDILLGQPMEKLEDGYTMSVSNDVYRFTKSGLIARLIQLRSTDFKVERQQLQRQSDGSSLSIIYDNYQEVDGHILPGEIKVDAVQGTDFRRVQIYYRSVTFGEELRFPFSFPSGVEFMQL
jgi:hypothetical protein